MFVDEKSVLREFYIQDQNILRLPYDNPIVAGLRNKGILRIIGNIAENSIAGMLMSIEINPRIKKQIKISNINLPKPEEDELYEDQKEFLINNRPDFMPEIVHHENLFHRGWWQ